MGNQEFMCVHALSQRFCYHSHHLFAGTKTVSTQCVRDQGDKVDVHYCEEANKPETGIFQCNMHPCPPRYYVCLTPPPTPIGLGFCLVAF